MSNTDYKPNLLGARVNLRAAQAGDEEYLIRAGRHAEISKMYGVKDPTDEPISKAGAATWLQSQIETPYAWVIEHLEMVIGALRFHSFDQTDRRASFAIGLFKPEYLNKGLGSEAMSLAFTYAFNDLDLHRISLRVLHFNERAIAAYKKLGFEIEGRERQSACIGDAWHDDIIMGLLKPEFTVKKVV